MRSSRTISFNHPSVTFSFAEYIISMIASNPELAFSYDNCSVRFSNLTEQEWNYIGRMAMAWNAIVVGLR